MKTLTIKLKQHTPIIHFQHDQEGATLRASEVKPKLDRFILSLLGDENYDKISDDEFEEVANSYDSSRNDNKKPFDDLDQKSQSFEVGKYMARKKGWLIGESKIYALNYKMRVQIEGSSNREEFLFASLINKEGLDTLQNNGINAISNTPYFAQEQEKNLIIKSQYPVKEWDKIGKKAIIEKGLIIISLICFDKEIESDLFDYISKHIQSFFISTNFGTRQSKGFGSFSVTFIEYEGCQVPIKNHEDLLKKNFLFVYKKNNISLKGKQLLSFLKIVFNNINDDYKLIKSGKSRSYAKSKIMLYMKGKGIRWEKKFIKEVFNRSNHNQRLKSQHVFDEHQEINDYRYCRALLGLAEQFEFLLENSYNSKMIVKINNSEIQRYSSPLLFKVIGTDIYLVGNEIEHDLLDKEFEFQLSIQNSNWNKKESISTPTNFNLKDFIRFAMNDKTNNASLDYSIIK